MAENAEHLTTSKTPEKNQDESGFQLTQKRRMNYYCEVCCTRVGSQQEQHDRGRKHKNKLRMLQKKIKSTPHKRYFHEGKNNVKEMNCKYDADSGHDGKGDSNGQRYEKRPHGCQSGWMAHQQSYDTEQSYLGDRSTNWPKREKHESTPREYSLYKKARGRGGYHGHKVSPNFQNQSPTLKKKHDKSARLWQAFSNQHAQSNPSRKESSHFGWDGHKSVPQHDNWHGEEGHLSTRWRDNDPMNKNQCQGDSLHATTKFDGPHDHKSYSGPHDHKSYSGHYSGQYFIDRRDMRRTHNPGDVREMPLATISGDGSVSGKPKDGVLDNKAPGRQLVNKPIDGLLGEKPRVGLLGEKPRDVQWGAIPAMAFCGPGPDLTSNNSPAGDTDADLLSSSRKDNLKLSLKANQIIHDVLGTSDGNKESYNNCADTNPAENCLGSEHLMERHTTSGQIPSLFQTSSMSVHHDHLPNDVTETFQMERPRRPEEKGNLKTSASKHSPSTVPRRVQSKPVSSITKLSMSRGKQASSKDNLLKLINQPRSRKERMKIESIIQTHHTNVQKQRPRLELESQDQVLHQSSLEDLPQDVQDQIKQLIEGDVGNGADEGKVSEINVNEENVHVLGSSDHEKIVQLSQNYDLGNQQDGQAQSDVHGGGVANEEITKKHFVDPDEVVDEENEEIDLLELMDSDEGDISIHGDTEQANKQTSSDDVSLCALAQMSPNTAPMKEVIKSADQNLGSDIRKSNDTEIGLVAMNLNNEPQNACSTISVDSCDSAIVKTELPESEMSESLKSGAQDKVIQYHNPVPTLHDYDEFVNESCPIHVKLEQTGRSNPEDLGDSDIPLGSPPNSGHSPQSCDLAEKYCVACDGSDKKRKLKSDVKSQPGTEDCITIDHVDQPDCFPQTILIKEEEHECDDTPNIIKDTQKGTAPCNQGSTSTTANVPDSGKSDLVDQVLQISLHEEEVHRQLRETMVDIERLQSLLAQVHEQFQGKLRQREQLLKEEAQLRRSRVELLKGAVSERKSQSMPCQNLSDNVSPPPGATNADKSRYTNALATVQEILQKSMRHSPLDIATHSSSSQSFKADSSTNTELDFRETSKFSIETKEEVRVTLPDTTTGAGEEVLSQHGTNISYNTTLSEGSSENKVGNLMNNSTLCKIDSAQSNVSLMLPDHADNGSTVGEQMNEVGKDFTIQYMGSIYGEEESGSLLKQLAVNMASLKAKPFMFMEEHELHELEASSHSESEMGRRSTRTRTISEASQDWEFKSPEDLKLKRAKKSKNRKADKFDEDIQDCESEVNPSRRRSKRRLAKLGIDKTAYTSNECVCSQDSQGSQNVRSKRKKSNFKPESADSDSPKQKKKKRKSKKERNEKRIMCVDSSVDEENEEQDQVVSTTRIIKKKKRSKVEADTQALTVEECVPPDSSAEVQHVQLETVVLCDRSSRSAEEIVPEKGDKYPDEVGVSSATDAKESRLKLDPCKLQSLRRVFKRDKPALVQKENTATSGILNFVGHSGAIYEAIVYQSWLLTCSEDSTVKKFNLKTSNVDYTYEQHQKGVHCIVVTSSGGHGVRLISGSFDGTVVLHDFQSGRFIERIHFDHRVHCCIEAWDRLHVGLGNGDMIVYDLKKNKMVTTFSCGRSALRCIASAREGPRKLLCVADVEGIITVRDATTNLLLRQLMGHDKSPMALQVFGHQVFSAGANKTVQVHNLYTGELEHQIKQKCVLSSLYVDDDFCLIGGYDGLVKLLSKENFDVHQLYYGAKFGIITAIVVHEGILYTGTREGAVEAINLDRDTKWLCQFGRCRATFGHKSHLLHHILEDHVVTSNPAALKCMWDGCHVFIPGKDKAQEAEKHYAIHLQDLGIKMKNDVVDLSDSTADSTSSSESATT